MTLMLIIGILLLLLFVQNKIDFIDLRNGSQKKKAEIVEYRLEKGPFRNDFTHLKYPYVRIKTDDPSNTLVRLKYANNWTKPFEIGEEVDVFWCGFDLLYWDAYNKGIYKLLPSSWRLKWEK